MVSLYPYRGSINAYISNTVQKLDKLIFSYAKLCYVLLEVNVYYKQSRVFIYILVS